MTTFHTLTTAIPISGPSSFSSANRELTPTTPRADKSFSNQGNDRNDRLGQPQVDESSLKTPTRDSFTGLAGQLPLPSSSCFPPLHHDRTESFPSVDRGNDGGSIIPTSSLTSATNAAAIVTRSAPRNGALKRGDSHQSAVSVDSQQDVEMGDGDDDGQDVGSDNDSDNGDSRRPSKKKKKGQRFFCTDFPPCQLSFTRSEHLARHIRKHTGERPFQCHCSRRFSRLDNLRQHAQTVHVNEDIPGDSLAATGTRFQRQIRTDRVRPPSSRSRNSTVGGGSVSHTHGHGHSHSHSHGHSRNLSSSSVDSSASAFVQSDAASRRRRPPPPLAIATDSPAQHRLSMESFGSHNASPASHHTPYIGAVAAGGNYVAKSPTRFGTPTSSIFSTETGSPKFSSGIQSPMTSAQQQSSTSSPSSSAWANGTAARRLSVPSAVNPFQPPPPGSHGYPPPYLSPLASSTASAFSPNAGAFASPTSSIFSESRNDPISAAEAEWRRRTWHPGTYAGQRPVTSSIAYNQRLGSPRPAFVPLRSSQAAQVPRLPGIESFDQVPPQLPSSVSNRRAPSPLRQGGAHQVSGHTHSASISTASASQYSQTHHIHRLHHQPRSTEHPNLSAWEMPLLHRGLNKLDIANNNNNNTSTNNSPAAAVAVATTSVPSDLPYKHQHSHSYTPGMFPASRQPFGAEAHKYNPSALASNTPSTQLGPLMQQSPQHEASQNSSVPSDPPPTPRRIKRLGWYNGPLASSPPGSSNGLNFASVQHGLPGLQMQMEEQQQHQQPQQQQHQQQQQQTSPEDSTSSSDGIPTPSSHSVMETDPAIIHSNESVEGPQKFNSSNSFQQHELKTATKMAFPIHPPTDTLSARACFVRNGEASSSAVSSNELAQEQVAHVPPRGNESNFSDRGKASTVTPSFDLGFGPGPVEYSSASAQGASNADGSVSGDTRRLDALVAVATREESDEMKS